MFSRFLNNRGEDPFANLQREIGRAVEDVFRGAPWRGPFGGSFVPSLELKDTPEGLALTAELPGLAENDIDLSLDGDVLTLRGEKRQERTSEEQGLHLAERSYGRFQRSLRLPFAPSADRVTAQFDKGVLTVTLPRPAPAAAASNRIPIRGQEQGQGRGTQAGGSEPPHPGTGNASTGTPGENQVTG
jgi:HSP20 family protein